MDLDAVGVFVKVVQARSFSGAARQLSMPNSTVSARVSGLERRLGTILLQRSTRKLRLTEAGEAYFRKASHAVELLSGAEAEVSSAQLEPQGLLRITAPVDIAASCLVDLISDFRRSHPKIGFEFVFTHEILDMIDEGIDIAIRAGQLKDSRVIARKLGTAVWATFASPAYLRSAGVPTHPKQLRDHALLQFTRMGKKHWRLSRGRSSITIPLLHQALINDASIVKALVVLGNGIALLPTYFCRAETDQGTLVRVLPEWIGKTDPVHLLYPAHKFVPAKLRAFVEVAVEALRKTFQE